MTKGFFGASGNVSAQKRLWDYLQSGTIHPAILLSGPDRENKFEIAVSIAKYFFCKKRPANKPYCGNCNNCSRIDKRIHPDVIIHQEEEQQIKIETIRQINHTMELSPMEGQNRICILDECHLMTVASSNAFLKTIEEPHPNRYFWLLSTKVGSVLPTILSRCLQFQFLPEGERFSPEKQAEFSELFGQFTKDEDLSQILKTLKDKERTLEFLQYLQKGVRDRTLDKDDKTFGDLSDTQSLALFQDALVVEGRLRSNANYGLMVENLLRKHFLTNRP